MSRPGMSERGRYLAAATAAVAWFALLLQLYLIVAVTVADGGSAVRAVVNYFSFFTVLTNLLVALTLAYALWGGARLGEFCRSASVQTAVAAYIAMVGIVYSVLLRHVWNPQGLQKVADVLLHDAVPLLYVAYWVAFVPKGSLRWSDPVRWLVYPLAYLVYVLVRGVVLTHYPYYFIDVRALGMGRVLVNAAGLTLAFLVLGFVFVGVGRLVERPRRVPA